jgi:hypothetical protein
VNYVSFWDAARFVNWLDNGQPIGAQGPSTTESGAYTNIGDNINFKRQPGATFFIPTEDEWYKAAYHDKTAGLAANYFDYPTRSNVPPGNDINEITNPGNNANYGSAGGSYTYTPVGEFELSESPYGTFDQAGNVWEWNETRVGTSTGRGLRGGNATNPTNAMLASNRRPGDDPLSQNFSIGFRVASVAAPEPSTLLLAAMAGTSLLWRSRALR